MFIRLDFCWLCLRQRPLFLPESCTDYASCYSRQAIKKYIQANNTTNAASSNVFDSQFNRALKNGVDKGEFSQPKGMSTMTYSLASLFAFFELSVCSQLSFGILWLFVLLLLSSLAMTPPPSMMLSSLFTSSKRDSISTDPPWSGSSGPVKLAKKETTTKPAAAAKPAAPKVSIPSYLAGCNNQIDLYSSQRRQPLQPPRLPLRRKSAPRRRPHRKPLRHRRKPPPLRSPLHQRLKPTLPPNVKLLPQ